MCEAIDQRCDHLSVPKHTDPFAEAQVGDYDDAGAFV